MHTVRARRIVWLVWLCAFLGALPAFAQQTGQVTELTITSPPPATFNASNPFRTNRNILRIEYTHNGASGNYFVTSNGADSEGTGFLPQPSDTTGDLFCDVGNEKANNPKTINLTLLQTRINVVAETNVPVVVVFDATPPTLNLLSLRVGGTAPGTGGTVFGLVPPTAGAGTPGSTPSGPRVFTVAGSTGVFRTRADSLDIAANANDTFTPLAQIQATSEVPEAGIPETPVPAASAQPGSFNANFSLTGKSDGTYTLTVRANDQVNDPFATATLIKGNVTVPHIVQIIRDTTPPQVTNIEVIRNIGSTDGNDRCGKPVSPVSTGANTFVGNEPVGIRLTFNEPITVPRVTVTQTNGTEQPLTPVSPPPGRSTKFTFQFQPFAVDAQNGPAQLNISGRNVGANSPQDPGEGTDEAGNGVTADQASAIKLPNAFVVDTFGPDLRKELPARQQTSPFEGQVVNGDQVFFTSSGIQRIAGSFPRVLSAQILDVPPVNTLSPNFASGVDFSQIIASGGATTVTSSGRLNITLTGPKGGIPVPPQVPVITGSPPSQLELRLVASPTGSLDELAGNPNFETVASNGVIRPIEGTYIMTINMIDKVCNTRQRQIRFTVDNTPIRESELQVSVGGRPIQRKGFCVPFPTGTPTRPFPDIVMRSTAGDFSTTSSRFAVLAKFNGNDSPEYPTVLTTFTLNPQAKTVSAGVVGIEKGDPTGVNFPIPTTAATDIIPAGVFDPRVAKNDGPYTIRLFPSDAAGNVGVVTTDGRVQTALDFDINLDTLMPITERTFPKDGSFINAPLRFIDATIVDPPAKRFPRAEVLGDFGNPYNVTKFTFVPGCGIDVNATILAARLENAYQPSSVHRELIEGATGSGQIQSGKIRGTLRFIHQPNDFDPTLPGFTPGDDRFKVLLEFAIPPGQNQVGTLPTDGSMDGTYSNVSVPVDRAGLTVSKSTNGSGPPARQGTYFGVTNTDTTTQSIIAFTWLYDTVAPRLHINNFPGVIDIAQSITHQGPLVLARQAAAVIADGIASTTHAAVSDNPQTGPAFLGKTFHITGFVQDLSAKGKNGLDGVGLNTQGGSGMDHVEYELKLVDAKHNLVPVSGGATNNLLGSPCADPAVDGDGRVTLGCLNPIISVKRAAMTTFPGVIRVGQAFNAIDPTPTVTDPIQFKPANPVLNTDFSTVNRPQHPFVIDDVLPDDARIPAPRASPGTDIYLFTIRAIDRAGNVTEIQREVVLGKITAPALREPADGACVNASAVTLKWAPVSNVTTYVVTLDQPEPLKDIVRPVGNGATQTTFNTLSKDGEYSWSVQSMDTVGNLSAPSRRTFKVDTVRPKVTAIAFGSGVIPVTRTGVLRLGKVQFQVQFSEVLSGPPSLTFDPASDSVGPQPTTTLAPNLPASVYTYEGEIPLTARAATWDGIAVIKLAGGKDQCGNPIDAQPPQTAEIDTGPDFESRFFFNPVAPQEIVLTLLTSEELPNPPRMTELNNLTQIGNETRRFQNTGKAFYSGFTLDSPDVSSEVNLTVALEDLDGNSSKRPLKFTVTPITQAAAALAVSSDRRLTVNVPAGAVVGQLPLYVLPPSDPTRHQAASTVHKLFPTAGTQKSAAVLAAQDAKPPTEQGLKILQYLNELAPGGVVLQKAATVTASPQGVVLPQGALPGQLGLYVWNGAKWTWTGASHDGQTVTGSLRNLGPLAMALDQSAPTVASVSIADGDRLDSSQPQLSAILADTGAGIGADGVSVLIDDQAVDFSYKEETGEVSFKPAKPLPPGAHTLALAVKDRAGNAAQTTKMKMLAPAPFGFSELIAYPNPAKLQSRIRTRITQPGVTQRVALEIYDVSGRRVRRLAQDAPFTGTAVDLVWDLVNDSGRGVANGVYLYQVTVTGTSGQKAKGRGKIAVQR